MMRLKNKTQELVDNIIIIIIIVIITFHIENVLDFWIESRYE